MTIPPHQPPPHQSSPIIELTKETNELTSWKVERENPIVQKHRLENETRDASHKRWRGTIFFVATIVALGYIFYVCAQIISHSNATPDDKKWATAIMTSIVSGSIGFMTGRAIA